MRKGRNILLLEIEELSIRFLATNNYVKGTEFELANQFNISCTEFFFPENFIFRKNFDYIGERPSAEFFFLTKPI